jgi:hypothetical protein
MSGSIGIDYSQLFGTANTTGTLLDAIYGVGTTPTTTPSGALQALQAAQQNQTQDIAAEAKQPQIASDIAAFKAALAKATTPAQLLQNPTALKVLLTVNGLSDQIPYTALAQKALLSNPSDTTSLANQLNATNSNWLAAVNTYQFATKGLSVLQQSSVQSTLTSAYAEISWRQSLDATTPGLSDALSFLQSASTFTSAAQILANPTVAQVIMTALNIPQQIAYQDIGAQEQAITSQLDITRLKDPKYVQTLAQEYLLNTATAAQASGNTPDLSALAVQATGLVV